MLSACQTSDSEGQATNTIEALPSQTRISTAELLASPTSIPATAVLESSASQTQNAQITILYVVENTAVKQVGNGSPEIIAEFSVANHVEAAALTDQNLFVLDDQGITQVNLADGWYERLMNFDKPALAGQLLIFDQGSKMIYSTVIEDLSTPSSFATIVGAMDLEHKRKS